MIEDMYEELDITIYGDLYFEGECFFKIDRHGYETKWGVGYPTLAGEEYFFNEYKQ